MKRLIALQFFVAVIFIFVGMFIQEQKDKGTLEDKQATLEKTFEERGVLLGQSAFEFGCIKEGTSNCENQNVGEDEFNTWMRNNCFQSIIDRCQDKAKNFGEYLSQKPSIMENNP